MGACTSKQIEGANMAENKMEAKANKKIEKAMKGPRADDQPVKLLLLGAGESGKSTVFKQMKILYGEPPSRKDREQYTAIVYNNTTSAMKMVVDQSIVWNYDQEVADQDAFNLILALPEGIPVDPIVGNAIKVLWNDPAIQKVWDRRSEFQVMDSMRYFLNNIDRIMADDYLATPEDFLYTRVRTTNVISADYELNGVKFQWFDVGGQRSQRRKWIHCFSDVTSVVYVAALSEYDQVLFEHTSTNRMMEALNLFEDISNLKYFEQSSIIVFLNKHDLFVQKLKIKPLNQIDLWSDYDKGRHDVKAAEEYFKNKFLERCPKNRDVYFHITTATSTTNIKFVFEACQETILKLNIEKNLM